MQFIDTSSKNPQDTLATWFCEVADEGVAAIDIQSGYFTEGSLDFLLQAISTEALLMCETHIVIGTNEPRTYCEDVKNLLQALGIPRKNAHLGVVGFDGGLFHPKCYVITRTDGSMAAYVGSANLTPSGLAKNIEAGLILDSRNSGELDACIQIQLSVRNWFDRGELEGFRLINGEDDIQTLIQLGVLSQVQQVKKSKATSSTAQNHASQLPSLKPLVTVPKGQWKTSKTLVAIPSLSIAPPTEPMLLISEAFSKILIAESTQGRPGKATSQIDIHKSIAENFFDGVGTTVNCSQLSLAGKIMDTADRVIGTKKSDNYYVELSGVPPIVKNSSYRERSLLLVAKSSTVQSNYLYFWLQPTDLMFDSIYDFFIAKDAAKRKGNTSIKSVKLYSQLFEQWPENPFALSLL